MNLHELLKETDALTYANSLRVTQSELKTCVSSIEELAGYLVQEVEKARKLMRKADNQYRLITKVIQAAETPFATDITVAEGELEIEELMKNERGE